MPARVEPAVFSQAYLVGLFEDTNLCAIHAKRVTIMPKVRTAHTHPCVRTAHTHVHPHRSHGPPPHTARITQEGARDHQRCVTMRRSEFLELIYGPHKSGSGLSCP